MAAETINDKACQASSTFCVTGGTGFVGSWLVKRLLHKGYTVHATTRHPENEARVRHLLDIPGAAERLKLFRAELLEDGSFEAAVAGCHGVFHVASPVDLAPKDAEEYAVSKILAEQAALQYGKDYDLDVVTIVPVLVVGSSITPEVRDSVQAALSPITGVPYLLQLLKGFQVLVGCIPLIHVDDLSSAHIFLMENPSAEGRYICSSINTSVPHLARYLSKRYPQYNVPT